jgi:acetyl-CoA acetyltransferase
MAVAAGLCRHALVFRCTWETTAPALARDPRYNIGLGDPGVAVQGDMLAWRTPYGAYSAGNWIGMAANRHFHLYGTRREHLGAIALNARRNAALNPYAIYREPLTMDDYLGARMITTPFGLYDCDTPCDGAIAVIVSAKDAARDTRRPDPLRLEAVGIRTTERWSWDQGTLDHEPMLQGPADSMWERTDLKPKDVDVAELYDGFTFNCLSWIEALGFCKYGEGGAFVEGGHRIALNGELPLNTHGGQLSAGRLQGFSFLHEACVQLWGEGGARQVPNSPQIACVSAGGGVPGGAMLLTR